MSKRSATMRIKRSSNALLLRLLLLAIVAVVAATGGVDGIAMAAAVTATTTAQLWAAANSQWQQQHMDETLALLLQIERVNPQDPMLPMALGAVYQSKVCVHSLRVRVPSVLDYSIDSCFL